MKPYLACFFVGEILYALTCDGLLKKTTGSVKSSGALCTPEEFLEQYGERVRELELDEKFPREMLSGFPRLQRLLCACLVEAGTFARHESLTTVALFAGSRVEGGAFDHCPRLSELWLYKGCRVDANGFYGCRRLVKVFADDGYVTLDLQALAGTLAQSCVHPWPEGGVALFPQPVADLMAWQGMARVYLPGGECYVGQISGGRFHGSGTFQTGQRNGRSLHYYRGQFENGVPHGRGYLHKTNGVAFDGEFCQGQICGKGVRTITDENVYTPGGRGVRRWTIRGDFSTERAGCATFWNGLERPEHLYYRGDFVDMEFHGTGELFITPNLVYRSSFFRDAPVSLPLPALEKLSTPQLRRVFQQAVEMRRDLEKAEQYRQDNPVLCRSFLDSVERDFREINALTTKASGLAMFPDSAPEVLRPRVAELLSHLTEVT